MNNDENTAPPATPHHTFGLAIRDAEANGSLHFIPVNAARVLQ